MLKKINYAADLRFLYTEVNALIRSLRYPADPDLFAEHIDSEIHFVATVTARVLRTLKDSSFRHERLQVLIDLRALAVGILDLLDQIIEERSPMAGPLADHVPRYRRIRSNIREMARDLDFQIGETSQGRDEGGPVVSQEELMNLLAVEE